MARIDEDELIEHWTLIGGELAEVAGKRGPTRLARRTPDGCDHRAAPRLTPGRRHQGRKPLQLTAIRRVGEPAIRRKLIIAKELYRHDP